MLSSPVSQNTWKKDWTVAILATGNILTYFSKYLEKRLDWQSWWLGMLSSPISQNTWKKDWTLAILVAGNVVLTYFSKYLEKRLDSGNPGGWECCPRLFLKIPGKKIGQWQYWRLEMSSPISQNTWKKNWTVAILRLGMLSSPISQNTWKKDWTVAILAVGNVVLAYFSKYLEKRLHHHHSTCTKDHQFLKQFNSWF
jgi:hypothetical protein